MYPAVFLDRDGVIIENRDDYVRSWSDVNIYPQALAALASLCNKPYRVVIITNQSAVGRGLMSLDTANEINQRLIQEIENAGGRVDGIYMCTHTPQDHCNCRKPNPGLILQATEILNIDLRRSILVGDALSDLLAGQAAGIKQTILVRTGRGAEQSALPGTSMMKPFLIYDTLEEALQDLITN